MSDTDWKFDLDDFDGDEQPTPTTESTSTGSSSIGDSLGLVLFMLPLSIIGVYAFVAKGAVLAAIEGIVGAGGLALAITNAFWIGGLIIAGILTTLAILTVLALLGGVVKRSGESAAAGLLGVAYFVVGYAGAISLFNSAPLLVGFVLTTNLIIYGGMVLIFLAAGVGTIIMMP